MLLLVSGEGPSDIGAQEHGQQGWVFSAGPMTHFIDRLVEHRFEYSMLGADCVEFMHKSELVAAKRNHAGGSSRRRASARNRKHDTTSKMLNGLRSRLCKWRRNRGVP